MLITYIYVPCTGNCILGSRQRWTSKNQNGDGHKHDGEREKGIRGMESRERESGPGSYRPPEIVIRRVEERVGCSERPYRVRTKVKPS